MKNIQEEKIDGKYKVDTGITVEEWIEILQDSELMRRTYKDVLIKFYNEPEHKSTCKNLSDKYGKNPQSYNATITQFGRAVQRKLNRFRIIDVNGKETFWSIIMNGKTVGNNYEWTIKTELVEAIEKSGLLSYDPIQEMIERYKTHIRNGGLKDELYKWELVQKFKGHPDTNAKNFTDEIRSLDISNMAYRMTKAVANKIANNNPEAYREAFINLFDEATPLVERVNTFMNKIKEIFHSQGETLSPHHNEREIATFLTYHNPEKYTFYMPKFYDFYCKMIGEETMSVGKKYAHYLELVNNLIEKYILPDEELLRIVDEELAMGDYYPDKSRKILTQDILRMEQRLNENKVNKTVIIANITWNSNDWKEPSKDTSGHEWVKLGGIPHESWNFDFENNRNPENKVYGYAKFTNSPKLKGSDNLVVFYSQDKIVGFYGGAELLPKAINISESESYNIIGTQNLSVLLNNKIENIVAKGYLEDKKRVGQVGFNYLKKNETVINIIEDAIQLNSEQENELNNLLSWFLGEEIQHNLNENLIKENKDMKPQPLNQILFGPPGTGKTYNTVNKAINIINPGFDTEADRNKTKEEFERLAKDGQIVFTTFHQSMTYEDFIEGIKPQKPTDNDSFLKYDIEPGIFKTACNNAKSIKQTTYKVDWEKPSYFKMSLGGKDRPDIHEWCINNNVIALGWGGDANLTKLSKITNWSEYLSEFEKQFPDLIKQSKFNAQATFTFIKMKINDIVVISKGNRIIDAVGVVKGDYYWDNNDQIEYSQFRKVEWIAKDLGVSPERFFKKQISQMTIYEFYDDDVKKEAFKEITGQSPEATTKPHVLIIDEINRGNISQIFGELITLIEEDKRLGNIEALEVTLPYSKEKFSVPNNLYIIGTMNTADRSVEALDTALRRRFSFEEMKSKPELITEVGSATNGFVDGVDLIKLLETLNKRIELLLDRDHQIGHSYFLPISNLKMLKEVFHNKIIPLLQEYFFGDFGKIGLTLGNGFVELVKSDNNDKFFAPFSDEYMFSDYLERPVYKIHNPLDLNDEQFKNAINILMNE